LKWSKAELDAYEMRAMYIQDERGRVDYALEKGKQIGIVEGKQIGIVEGKQIGIVEGKQIGIVEGKQIGIVEGKQIGIVEGKQIGIVEGKQIGITEGEKKKALEMAGMMKKNNEPVDKIIQYTGLSKEEIDKQ
jgi:predicted transposase YdaD